MESLDKHRILKIIKCYQNLAKVAGSDQKKYYVSKVKFWKKELENFSLFFYFFLPVESW